MADSLQPSSQQSSSCALRHHEPDRSHSRGPLDGSLYAKVNKNKKSDDVDSNHVTEKTRQGSISEGQKDTLSTTDLKSGKELADSKPRNVVVVNGNKIIYNPKPDSGVDPQKDSAPLATLTEFGSPNLSIASSRDSLPSYSSITKVSVTSSPTVVSPIKQVLEVDENNMTDMETDGAIEQAAALIVDDVIKKTARFSEISSCSATTLSSTSTEEEGRPQAELSEDDTCSETALSDLDGNLSPVTVEGRESSEILIDQALDDIVETERPILLENVDENIVHLSRPELEKSSNTHASLPPPTAAPPNVPPNPSRLSPEDVFSNGFEGGFDKGPEYAVPMRDMKITTIPSKRAVLVSTGNESDDMAAQTSDRRDSVYDDGNAYNGAGYETIEEYNESKPVIGAKQSAPAEEHSYIPEDVQELLNGLQDGPTISDIDSGFHGSSMALQASKSPVDHINVTSQSSSELSDPFSSPPPTQSNEPSPTYDGSYTMGKMSPTESPVQSTSGRMNHSDGNAMSELKVQAVAMSTPTRKNLNPGIPIPTQTPPEPQPAKVQIITMRHVYMNDQGVPINSPRAPSTGSPGTQPVSTTNVNPSIVKQEVLQQQKLPATCTEDSMEMVTMRTKAEPEQKPQYGTDNGTIETASSPVETASSPLSVHSPTIDAYLDDDVEDQLDSDNIKSVEEQIKHAQKHLEFLKEQQEKLVKRKQDRSKYRETLKRSSSTFEKHSPGYNSMAPVVTATMPRQPSKPEANDQVSVAARSQTLQRNETAKQFQQQSRNMPPITSLNQTVAAQPAQQTPTQNSWNTSGPVLTKEPSDMSQARNEPVQPALPAKQVSRQSRNQDKADIIMSSDLQEQLAELDRCIAELTTSMDTPVSTDDSQPQSTQEPQVVLRQRSYTLEIERKMDPNVPESSSNASSAPKPPTRSKSSFDSYKRLSQEFDIDAKRNFIDQAGSDDVFSAGSQAARKKKPSQFPPQTSVTRRQHIAPAPPPKRRISLEERLSPGLFNALAFNPGAKPKENIHSYKEDLAPEADVPDTPTFPISPGTPYVNNESPGRAKSPVGLAKTPLSALHLQPTEKPMESLHHVESPIARDQLARSQPSSPQEDVVDGRIQTPNEKQSPVQEPTIKPVLTIPNGHAKETALLSDRSDSSGSPNLLTPPQQKDTIVQAQFIMNGQLLNDCSPNAVGGFHPKVGDLSKEYSYQRQGQSRPPNHLNLPQANLSPTSLHGTPQGNANQQEPITPQQHLLNHSGTSHSSHSHSPAATSSNSRRGSSDSLDGPSTRHSNSSVLSSSSSSSAHHPGLPMTSPNNVRPGSQLSSYERHLLPSGMSGHRSGDESLGSPQSGRTSSSSISDVEKMNYDVSHATVSTAPKFIRDTTAYWYKPDITRDQALAILRSKPAGSFVVRDSRCFPGAFGLALKVDKLPPNVQAKPGTDIANEYVRHFLIEPSSRGVKLKGCPNEPVFGSLSALVYQHSITALALPCRLIIPTADQEVPQPVNTPRQTQPETPAPPTAAPTNTQALLKQGAACNVIYIGSVDTESLTGPPAIERAVRDTYQAAKANSNLTSIVHFKVSPQGITLTDNARKIFFRRHYPTESVTFCGLDPLGGANKGQRRWDATSMRGSRDAWLFGFVARKQSGSRDNTCHVFAELDQAQPARAIVNFVMKILIGSARQNSS